MDVPTRLESVTSEWLTTILAANGVTDGSEVTSITAERLGEKEAFLGTLSRLRLSYSSPQLTAPKSLVAKFATSSIPGVNTREVGFYTQIATRHDLPVPRCYYGGVDPESGFSLLLLEDLSHLDRVDFLVGCTPLQAAVAVAGLSKLHIAWWDDPAVDDFDPAFSLADLPFPAMWEQYPGKIEALFPGFPLSKSLVQLGDLIADQTAEILNRLEGSPATCIHRDIHVDNLLFEDMAGHPAAVIVDWQFVGRGKGASDVGYLLISSLSTPDRRRSEKRIAKSYHALVVDSGVSDYDFEDCWSDYRLSALAKLWMTVAATVLVDNSDDHRRAWRAADLQRLTAFIEDHQPRELLA